MEILILVLLIAAVVLFAVAAFGVSSRLNLVALGLACVAAALVLERVPG